MLDYGQDLQFDLILPRLKLVSAKQVLMECAREAAKFTRVSESLLFAHLMAKENEHPSGIGEGVAMAADGAYVGAHTPVVTLAADAPRGNSWSTCSRGPIGGVSGV